MIKHETFGQIRTYSLESGLSQSTIYSITKDSLGFIWVATGDGVNRFDGYRFEPIPIEPYKGVETHNFNSPFAIMPNGSMWIAGNPGIFRYDTNKRRFVNTSESIKPGSSNKTYTIIGHTGNILWSYISSYEIIGYDIKTGKLITSTKVSDITSACMFKENILVGTYNGLFSINTKTKIQTLLADEKEFIKKIQYLEGTDEVLYSCGEKLVKLNLKNKVWLPDKCIVGDHISFLYLQDKIYVGKPAGELWILDKDLHVKEMIKGRKEGKDELPEASVYNFFADDDALWIGTDGGGLCFMSLAPKRFSKFCSNYNGLPSFSSDFIKCFYVDAYDRIWFGTLNGGLHILEPTSKKLIIKTSKNGLPGTSISALYKDKKNRIWIAADKGICYTDDRCEKFTLVPMASNINKHISSYLVSNFLETSNGTLAISTPMGMFYLDENLNHFVPSTTFRSLELFAFEDLDKRLWISDYYGPTWICNLTSNVAYANVNNAKILMRAQNIRCIWQSPLTKYLYAASEFGLYEISPDLKKIKKYTAKDGLGNSFTYGIVPGKTGTIWISTNSGLSEFDLQKKTFKNYSLEDNLQSAEFNTGAYYADTKGYLYFGGVKGFNRFKANYTAPNYRVKPIRITGINLHDKSLPMDSVLNEDGLKFAPADNSLDIVFALLDYTNPAKNRYSYRLKGGENRWIYLGTNHRLFLSNLAPGNYELWVKAQNWNEAETPPTLLLKFTIKSPLYKKWWFIFLTALLLLAIVAAIVAYLVRQRLKVKLAEEKRQREVLQIKQNISRELHDNLGANLSRLSLMLQHSQNIGKEGRQSHIKQSDMGDLAKEMNKQLSEIVWSVSTEHDNLASLLAYIRIYAVKYMEGTGIELRIDFSHAEDNPSISPEVRQNLYALTKEALNNIVKHSQATKVQLEFTLHKNLHFEYKICDNGIGFDPNNTREFANGLKNMRNRMEEIGFVFRVESNNGSSICVSGELGG